jgi:hypothetical protein
MAQTRREVVKGRHSVSVYLAILATSSLIQQSFSQPSHEDGNGLFKCLSIYFTDFSWFECIMSKVMLSLNLQLASLMQCLILFIRPC